jgi:two-component system, OmpR family, sensor histidine kinase BaeS
MNLASNALRHTTPGGEITVTGSSSGNEVRLAVSDTGEGLDPDELVAVFDRFYRGDKSRSRDTGGTGLGLAIVKAIVEAHDGHVEARSDGKGLGSTFALVLPAIEVGRGGLPERSSV